MITGHSEQIDPRAHPTGAAAGPGLPALLLALAGALVANTALGPLVAGVVSYPVSGPLLDQLLGLELVTVLVVAPMAAGAAALLRRGRAVAPFLGVGAGSYTAYMFAQYVLGPGYTTYRPVVLLHLGIFVLGVTVLTWSWLVAMRTPVPAIGRRPRRWYGALLLGLAAFVLARYLPVLVGAASSTPLPHELAAAPGFYWSIVLLDLGLVVPVTVASGVGVLRGSRTAGTALYAVVVWFALVPVSVAAMSIVMLARDDPAASIGQTLLLSTAALVCVGVAIGVCTPMLDDRATSSDPPRRALPGPPWSTRGWARGATRGSTPGAARRPALAAYTALLAVAAYGGAGGLSTGFLALPADLERRLPFGSPALGALALALVVGVPATVVTALAWRGDQHTDLATAADGFLLVGWIAVELAFLRDLSVLHVVYALVGLSLIVWGALGDKRCLRRS